MRIEQIRRFRLPTPTKTVNARTRPRVNGEGGASGTERFKGQHRCKGSTLIEFQLELRNQARELRKLRQELSTKMQQ